MVEGSQIDWAGHDNDFVGAMMKWQTLKKHLMLKLSLQKKISIR